MIRVLSLFIHRWFRLGDGRKLIVFPMICLIGMAGPMIPVSARAAAVEIMTPRSGATIITELTETHLVLRQPVSEEESRIRLESHKPLLKPEVVMEDGDLRYLHFRLPLVPGKNQFTIIPGDQLIELNYRQIKGAIQGKAFFEKDVYLFHLDDKLPNGCEDCHDLHESASIDPMGELKGQPSCAVCHKNLIARIKWKHSPMVNNQCLICHLQSAKPWRIGIPAGKIDDTCFICHNSKKELESKKHRHGPMIAGCILCHDPHGDEYRYFLWADGALDICITCHSDKRNLVNGKDPRFTLHGVIRGPGCVVCHDPHASDERYQLRKPVNMLCLGCHQDNIDIKIGHPVAGHPNAGPKELRRPGRELTCVGCHDPHGSSHESLLVETKRGGLLCRGCHKR